MAIRILCINPGSTSTKIAVFSDDNIEFNVNIMHTTDELKKFAKVQEQLDYRFNLISKTINDNCIDLSKMDAVVGRGGSLPFKEGGVYNITNAMLEDCRSGKFAEHPSNLGCQLAKKYADLYSLACYIVDPPLLDEFEEVSRISGYPRIERKSAFHALNEKNVARKMATDLGKKYEEINLVTTHLGSGISVTAHKRGRCVDNTYGSGGDGPFSPERSGRLPALELLKAIDKGPQKADYWKKIFTKQSGICSYLGTNNMLELGKRMESGEFYVKEILDAMAHMIAREVAAYCTILNWEVDGIGITGAIAKSKYIVSRIQKGLKLIAPVFIYPGEFEMEALAAGARRVLLGEEKPKDY